MFALALGLGAVLLLVLILRNDSSIVTRGPANANQSLNAAWNIVRSPSASPTQLIAAETKARVTLHREPLNSVAISLIGTLRERQGKAADSQALMSAAVRTNHRENIAELWLFDHLLAEKNYDQAFVRADALLRREQNFTRQLLPQLSASLTDPAAYEPLGQRLAKAPSWRPVFMEALSETHPNPAATFKLYAAIKAARGEITPDELSALLLQLVAAGRYEEAYLDWLILLPDQVASKVTNIYDGDFSGLPDTRPFGWNFSQGATGFIEPPPGRDDPALHIIYNGSAKREFPAQLLVLPPGQYALVGEVMTATTSSAGRLGWQIQCVGDPPVAVALAPVPDTAGRWVRFSTPFAVPPGCSAQRLVLDKSAAAQEAEIDVWYDKLNVQPAGAAR